MASSDIAKIAVEIAANTAQFSQALRLTTENMDIMKEIIELRQAIKRASEREKKRNIGFNVALFFAIPGFCLYCYWAYDLIKWMF